MMLLDSPIPINTAIITTVIERLKFGKDTLLSTSSETITYNEATNICSPHSQLIKVLFFKGNSVFVLLFIFILPMEDCQFVNYSS